MPVYIENKEIILVGGSTSHGGTVLSGSSPCLKARPRSGEE